MTGFLCTLWLADYYIARAEKVGDLKKAMDVMQWSEKNSLPSGVLAEQLDAKGSGVSVAPLTWSHSTLIATVSAYIKKINVLSRETIPPLAASEG